jgi:hypothetical protein
MMLAGPIVPTILALAAPNVLNVAMQSLVSTSDGWFVGQLGVVDLAALALVFPTQMTLGMMSAGAMGGGISSSVARALGAGNRAAAEAARPPPSHRHVGLFAVVRISAARSTELSGSGAASTRRGLRHPFPAAPPLGRQPDGPGAARDRRYEDRLCPVATAAPDPVSLALTWAGWLPARHPRPALPGRSCPAAVWMLSKLLGPTGAFAGRGGFRGPSATS